MNVRLIDRDREGVRGTEAERATCIQALLLSVTSHD